MASAAASDVTDAPPPSPPPLGPDGWQCVLRHAPLPVTLRIASVSHDVYEAAKACLAATDTLDVAALQCGLPDPDDDAITDEVLEILVDAMPSLTSLTLTRCGSVSDYAIAGAIASVSQTLTSLDLSETALGNDAFASLWTTLPALTSLDVEGCLELTDELIHLLLAEEGDALRPVGPVSSLCVSSLPNVGPASAASLAVGCKDTLTVLDISRYELLAAPTLADIVEQCSSLRVLRAVESELLDDSACERLHARLRKIELSWCTGVSTDAVRSIATACPMLEELEVRCCTGINAAEAIHALSTFGGEHIAALNLNRCDGALPEAPIIFGYADGSRTFMMNDGTRLQDHMLTEPSHWLEASTIPSLTCSTAGGWTWWTMRAWRTSCALPQLRPERRGCKLTTSQFSHSPKCSQARVPTP